MNKGKLVSDRGLKWVLPTQRGPSACEQIFFNHQIHGHVQLLYESLGTHSAGNLEGLRGCALPLSERALQSPLSFILRVYQFIKLVLSMVSVRRGAFVLLAGHAGLAARVH